MKKILVTILMMALLPTICYANEETATGYISHYDERSSNSQECWIEVHSHGEPYTPKDLLQALEDAEQEKSWLELNEVQQESLVLTTLMEKYEGQYWEAVWTVPSKYYQELTPLIYEDAIKYNYNVMISEVVTSETDDTDGKQFKVYIRLRDEEEYDIVDHILYGNNDNVGGSNHWNSMLITGIDIQEYEQSLQLLEEWQNEYFNVVEVKEDEAKNSFSVLIESSTYCVMEGDTLSEIAQRKATSVEELMELNPHISDPNLIYVYDHLKIR